MASPYRGGGSRPDAGPVDDGIVGDLVRQFADRFAFLRELVQNSIDAGSTQIDVRVHVTEDGLRIATRDDGEGMDPEVLEEKLLVLFRSGKEGQTGKIGKFGVGFISVLAVEPERVTVQTSRGEGPAWTLHLHRDHSYELFESGRAQKAGTTVALEVPVPVDEHETFATSAHASLSKWCRHASIPIRFTWPSGKTETINRPLALDDSVLEVRRVEGDTTVVVGLPPMPGETYAGFFNHGLTLYETQEPHSLGRHARLFAGRAFKVMAPGLEHTLSRDNVRRDAAFERALKLVARCIEEDLADAFVKAVAAAARDDLDRHLRLLSHWDATFPVAKASITVPLLHGEPRNHAQLRGRATYASRESPVTRALVDQGHDVVTNLSLHSRERLGLKLAEETVTLVEPLQSEGSDALLLEALQDLLEAHRKPSAVQLARFYGMHRGTYAGGPFESRPWLSFERLDSDPFRRLMRPALLLDASDRVVMEARQRAVTEPLLAAAILARVILTAHEAMDARVDAALTVRSIDRVLSE